MSLRTPLLLAAHNEAEIIASTLTSFAASDVEAIVISNGSTDDTSTIARAAGATVIELGTPGKMLAIQAGLQYLVDEGAGRQFGPILMSDADSRPHSPKWADLMVDVLTSNEGPAVASGITLYHSGSPVDMSARVPKRFYESFTARRRGNVTAVMGYNMGIKLESQDLVTAILDLPRIWPGEDKAIARTILERGGQVVQLLALNSAIVTSARYQGGLLEYMRGPKRYRESRRVQYAARANGATHAFRGGKLVPYGADNPSDK